MGEQLSAYTPEEFENALCEIIKGRIKSTSARGVEKPQAFLLGGQSGAGKTTLHTVLRKKLAGNVIVINGDEYRRFHPRYVELDERYGVEAVDYTARWSGHMTEALVDELSRAGYNLIVEGTLRTAEVPKKSAKLLRARGYSVSLALMAVKPEISLISCQIRYEEMKAAGTIPRATNPAHHNMIVDQIVSNVAELEKSDLFDQIYLYARSKELLYPQRNSNQRASEVMKDVLFGSWTQEEQEHYLQLQAQYDKLIQSPRSEG